MSIERARAHLYKFGLGERIIETAASSATVAEAAAGGGTGPRRIAVTSFTPPANSAQLVRRNRRVPFSM